MPKTRRPRLDTHDLRGTFFAVPSGAENEKGRLPEGGCMIEHHRTRSANPGAVPN
jgi:hypothetical protein